MSSLSLSSESDDSSSSGHGTRDQDDQSVTEPAPRSTREEYQSYAALVHSIDIGDTLIAKRIIATHTQHVNVPGKATNRATTSSQWPLHTSDLAKLHDPDALEESILAFASAYIRDNNLVLPRLAHAKGDDQSLRGMVDLDETLPSLLPDIMSKVDRLLNNLAVMRPPAVKKKRREMKPMGWSAVLSAEMLGSRNADQGALRKSNTRVRDVLQVDGDDSMSHRLDLLQAMNPVATTPNKADQTVKGKRKRKENPLRPHQSQQEREERAAKRERREAKRAERAQAQAAQEATKRLSKSAKRRQRRQAKAKS